MSNDKLKKYGLSEDDYAIMLENQNGSCAICGDPQGARALAIDHDHATDEVRGLLCTKCNLGLGYFNDSAQLLENARMYLSRNLYTHPLCGKFFLTPREQNGWQGRVLEFMGGGLFIIQLFSWVDGYATDQKIAKLDDMQEWTFYRTPEEWRDAGDKMTIIGKVKLI